MFPDSISFLVDLLTSELIPEVFRLVNSLLSSHNDSVTNELFESKPDTVFWSRIMESISDPYTVERISELILHKLATQDADDVQAYWVLWLLFHRIFKLQPSVRWVKILVYFAFVHGWSENNAPFDFKEIEIAAPMLLVIIDIWSLWHDAHNIVVNSK